MLCIDLALGGMKLPIPPDEVVEAMYRVGRMLPPQLRETAQGGIAATKSGQEFPHPEAEYHSCCLCHIQTKRLLQKETRKLICGSDAALHFNPYC